MRTEGTIVDAEKGGNMVLFQTVGFDLNWGTWQRFDLI